MPILTELACVRAAIRQTLEHGYAHHIQRHVASGRYIQRMSNYCAGFFP